MAEKPVMTETRSGRLLFGGAQLILDLSILIVAFVLAYLLRFDFDLPDGTLHKMAVQLPFVVLLQFVALTLSGGRNFIWRYTGMAHVKAFLYAGFGSMAVVFLMRLLLPDPQQAWRVPLSVNLFDGVLAFGGVFGLRVWRRSVYEYQK